MGLVQSGSRGQFGDRQAKATRNEITELLVIDISLLVYWGWGRDGGCGVGLKARVNILRLEATGNGE